MNFNRLLRLIGLCLVAAAFPLAPARAETINCTAITSLPYTISAQGVYCLTGHLSTGITSGNAITINTNNVVLDLNGFKIGGQSAGLGTGAYGIYANQRQNITIKNGTVRGFYEGIVLDDLSPYGASQGHVIEDIRADQNTYIGMNIAGNGNIIRNNQVVATGGMTTPTFAVACGIEVQGPGAQVLNNMVTEVTAQGVGSATGIYVYGSNNGVVAGNRIGNITSPSGATYGIHSVVGTNLIVSDNRLSGMQEGISFSSSTGKYFSNVTQGVGTPYTGGTAAGATNY